MGAPSEQRATGPREVQRWFCRPCAPARSRVLLGWKRYASPLGTLNRGRFRPSRHLKTAAGLMPESARVASSEAHNRQLIRAKHAADHTAKRASERTCSRLSPVWAKISDTAWLPGLLVQLSWRAPLPPGTLGDPPTPAAPRHALLSSLHLQLPTSRHPISRALAPLHHRHCHQHLHGQHHCFHAPLQLLPRG